MSFGLDQTDEIEGNSEKNDAPAFEGETNKTKRNDLKRLTEGKLRIKIRMVLKIGGCHETKIIQTT